MLSQTPIMNPFPSTVITQSEVTLQADVPYLRVSLSHRAVLECCYNTSGKSVKHTWVKSFKVAKESFGPLAVNFSEHVFEGFKTKSGCSTLTLRSVQLNDTGMYQCWLNSSDIRLFSHGTYLQVFSECVHVCVSEMESSEL